MEFAFDGELLFAGGMPFVSCFGDACLRWIASHSDGETAALDGIGAPGPRKLGVTMGEDEDSGSDMVGESDKSMDATSSSRLFLQKLHSVASA